MKEVKEAKEVTNWYWPKRLSSKQCDDIISLGTDDQWKPARLGYYSSVDNRLDENIRKSDECNLSERWILDLLFPIMLDSNKNAGWCYDITSCEHFKLLRYTETGHFNWHVDGLGTRNSILSNDVKSPLYMKTRKISMTIFLNDDYEGGEFELYGETGVSTLKEQGTIFFFPSFMFHRIKPITKGVRYSLAGFFVGPPFY